MSTKVVPAPANQATQPVRSDKLAKQSEKQQAVQDQEKRLAEDEAEVEISVDEAEEAREPESSLAGDFEFDGALAEAAAASGSLISEQEGTEVSVHGNYGDEDGGGTILLIGAILLVGAGIAALASGGGDDEPDVPLNDDPSLTVDMSSLTVDENSDGDTVVATATDPDGDNVTISATNGSNGTVTAGEGGSFTYKPNANFNGSDSFTITADDGNGGTDTQTITVTVTSTNQAPVVGAGATMTIVTEVNMAQDFVVDVTDPDGDNLTITFDPANGDVTDNGDGTYTYTPDPDFTGEDDFTVTIDDGETVVTYDVDVTVNPEGTGPTEQSIDVGTTSTVVPIEAGDDDYLLTDDATAITNVNINDMGPGDVIQVTNATADDYNFGTAGDDLEVTFNDGSNFTSIIIDLAPGNEIDGLVFDLDSAIAAVGFEFMTFG